MTVLNKLPIARNAAGFTLLEMTIVIAIIGLLIGGVLATQSYIRGAEMTTTINEAKYLINAFNQFQQKYGSVPGEMPDAQNYWGSGACPRATGTTYYTYVCNGDGGGYLYFVPSGTNNDLETFYAFEHMARAGMIAGAYTGVAGSLGSTDSVPGTNVFAASYKPGAMFFQWYGNASGYLNGSGYYDGMYGNTLLLAGDVVADGYPTNALFTVREASELDNKFDNGKPGTGWMRVRAVNCGDADVTAPTTANYLTTNIGKICVFALNTR
jgi:prepilin-type N-terminal cleavage/methylation domain-containing protein